MDFKSLLNKAKIFNIPMICSNPDEQVFDGNLNQIVSQSGCLAKHYASIGGDVKYFGKPYVKIYEECTLNHKIISKNKIICIGDSLITDIKGANNYQIDSILIKSGIHNKELLEKEVSINALLKNYNSFPNYILNEFKI